jgi:DNA polymerase/3'-5' exonuclease PolX
MELVRAKEIADKYKSILSPFCERIEIAGSIRRERPKVNDIEIVCIPRPHDIAQFVYTVKKWTKIKGEPTGKYTQRKLDEGIYLDLFIANKNNWGMIYAIRTGSAEYSHKVLAVGWVKKGYMAKDGILYDKSGKPAFIREEIELFNLIGRKFVLPKNRII